MEIAAAGFLSECHQNLPREYSVFTVFLNDRPELMRVGFVNVCLLLLQLLLKGRITANTVISLPGAQGRNSSIRKTAGI